jgi:acetolactate synthase-1/2/3 large subunit
VPPPRDGGRLLVDILQSAGIDAMFGLEGGHVDPIIHAARDVGMRLIDVRHEAVAGYAADGYVRTTGRPAVCVVTAGPGFTNVISAVVGAYLDRIPVLFVAGAVPLKDAETNALQGAFDQVAMVRPVTKWAERATSVDVIPAMVKAALRAMFDGAPGPSFLEVPIDVVFADADDDIDRDSRFEIVEARPAPSPDAVRRALSHLMNAERPVILVGTGALLSGCTEELRTFVEAAGVPVYANPKALGVLPGSHPMACGSFTNLVHLDAEPDLVLILGARNGMFMGGRDHDVIPYMAEIIHVDVDRREIGRLHPATVSIVADCRETLSAFNRASVTYPDRSAWVQEAANGTSWHRRRYADAFDANEEDMHPYRAACAIAEFVDERTIVVADGGDTGSWVEITAGQRAAGPGKYFGVGYLGNLGMHQGLAIAAQIAHPDHRVICATGDGSIGLQIQEFDTMVRHGLPIVTVVFNNRMWGMSYEYQIRMPRGLTWVELADNMRYDLICEACGGHGEFVANAADLPAAIERALAAGRPACVNVLTRSEASPKSEMYLKADGIEDTILPYYDTPARRERSRRRSQEAVGADRDAVSRLRQGS